MKGGKLNCLLGVGVTPKIQPKIKPWRQNSGRDIPGWVGHEPIPEEGMGWGGGKAPPFHAQAGTSHLPLALYDPTLMNGSTTPWKASSCNKRTGQGYKMPLHRKKKNQGSRSHLRWMRSWVLNWTFSRSHSHLDCGDCPWPKKDIPSSTARPCTPTKSPQHKLSSAGGAQPKVPVAAFFPLILGKARKREARLCQLSPPMAFWGIVSIQQPSPPLVEWNNGKWKAQHRGMHHAGGVWKIFHLTLSMAADSL